MAVTNSVHVERRWKVLAAALFVAFIFAVTVVDLISRGGAPDRWWQLMLAPVHMVAGVFGGGG